MKSPGLGLALKDPRYRRYSMGSFFPKASLFCLLLLFGGIILVQHGKEVIFQFSACLENNASQPGPTTLAALYILLSTFDHFISTFYLVNLFWKISAVPIEILSKSIPVADLFTNDFLDTASDKDSEFFMLISFLQRLLKWKFEENFQHSVLCEGQYRPRGSEPLPKGIVVKTSNLETRPLWGHPKEVNSSRNLFSVAVGIKQKETVDKMVRKFLAANFVVMLFHYDGIVDQWKDLEWSSRVIHISAINQTKWWFAKRFLHPDIVAEYDYVFLWDEDLGVENFNPERYLEIVKREGLEISQPALDTRKSEVHHQITARGRRSIVHRRTYKPGDNGTGCDYKSNAPPCTGWIEVMAPVFSKAAWRCVWYMIQNDLIHAWGLDTQLGYCAQGDRTKNIGVVDAEYIVHYGIPTLGEPKNKTKLAAARYNYKLKNLSREDKHVAFARFPSNLVNHRIEVRRESYREYRAFKKRWKRAVEEDECWRDPYQEPIKDVTI